MVLAPRSTKQRIYRPLVRKDLENIPQLAALDPDEQLALKTVSLVLPFRTNSYVIEELIDWDNIPADPMYQLTFPQRGMMNRRDYKRMLELARNGPLTPEGKALVQELQKGMNPHPAGQMELNVPRLGERSLRGMQHKYRETVLFFPSQGQTCHAYCTYCFRWPQFVGIDELKFASHDAKLLTEYVQLHQEVTDVLFTGGDPMIMKASRLRAYIEPLLKIDHIGSIRIGTKALAYWPYRFTTDPDHDEIARLFEKVVKSGKQLAIMAHFSHPVELSTKAVRKAITRIRNTGATIRSQAPVVRHVNDHFSVWSQMWRRQLRLGITPYYMFVERDTGPKQYFQVPLGRCYHIFQTAYRKISGLGRTVRGPSMSATPGKVVIEGITRLGNEKVFVLTMLQGRNPKWVKHPFFAKYDEDATWLTDLKPAFGAKEFFFQAELEEFKKNQRVPAWSQPMKAHKKIARALFGHVEWE